MSKVAQKDRCRLCGEPYSSSLRYSTTCSHCKTSACSSCCRPSPLNPTSFICISCIRFQKHKDDVDDDRPKWLREAQDLRKAQAPSASSNHLFHPAQISAGRKKAEDVADDRPKWLREAQEKSEKKEIAPNQNNLSAPLTSSSSSSTDAIEERLRKLKEEVAVIRPTNTEDELMARIARLRDQDPAGKIKLIPLSSNSDNPRIILSSGNEKGRILSASCAFLRSTVWTFECLYTYVRYAGLTLEFSVFFRNDALFSRDLRGI